MKNAEPDSVADRGPRDAQPANGAVGRSLPRHRMKASSAPAVHRNAPGIGRVRRVTQGRWDRTAFFSA